ncbi:hypothetical protein RM553_16645 [Zunongwangia sp. F363]|uniref:Uncharacterized protein n=1 Tax=Autumnicola tepida TaxID=3075595 RepID=A0ABU3CEQ4_9FLAO|nr:hypothetical protein [Zunongwangia sp. F363]MDT0644470.1 hypothetical protein [Zunongwangia sp. F363]
MKLEQRLGLIGLAGLLVAGFVYTNLYIHKKNRQDIKEIAEELAYAWKSKLNLTLDQVHKLEELIIEYTIKKNEIINSSLKHDSQITKLKSIQKSENTALKKLFNEEQFENYTAINRQITQKS